MSTLASKPLHMVSPIKKVVFFPLENILIPGPFVSQVNVSQTKRFLQSFSSYASKHAIFTFLISAFPRAVALEKVSEHSLSEFFSDENIFAVNSVYLEKMDPLDRARYDSKLKDNPACTDEYYRQAAMQEIMKTKSFSSSECLLVGNDFWFDGFYTRRYSQVDVVFVEPTFTSRGKPIVQKIDGLWYSPLSFKSFQKFLDGKISLPNYTPLDTWASVTLTEELLGAKDFNMVKRVILERKKDGALHPLSFNEKIEKEKEKSEDNNRSEINPPFA